MTRQEEKKLEREFFDLTARLNSQYESTRSEADAELQSLPTDRLTALWTLFRRKCNTAHKYKILTTIAVSITCIATFWFWQTARSPLFSLLFFSPMPLLLGGMLPSLKAFVWKEAVRGLTRSDDVRVIEPLVQLLPDSKVIEALTRLLSHLKPSDAAWFTESSRNRLRSFLFSSFYLNYLHHSHPKLAESFLYGMAAIGDRDTLVNIALLIVRDAPTADDQHLREVARECLPMLQENAFGSRVEEIPALIESLPVVPAITTGMVTQKQYIAVLGLAHLLPRLTQEEGRLLTPELRRRLCINLGGLNLKEDFVTLSRLGPDYSLAVIGALTRFGSAESLPALQKYAEGKYHLWQLAPQDERRVQLAASLAIPVVEARAAAEQESETLLRGSQAPEPSGDTLLRPAAAAPETEPQQLLRASNPISPD